MTVSGNFEHFLFFDFETNSSGKLKPIKSTKIKSASFPYKTLMSEGNVKTNRMVSTK